MGLFNVVPFYAAYGSYHHNTTNKTIHIVGVPAIVWSFLLFFTLAPPLPVEPISPLPALSLTWGAPLVLILIALYTAMDVAVGLFATVLLGVSYCGANLYLDVFGATSTLHMAVGIQVVGWGTQFLGHAVFEKRRPALFDNLLQVFIAPFFVMLEILFLFGYKKEVQEECEKVILSNIQKMDAAAERKNK